MRRLGILVVLTAIAGCQPAPSKPTTSSAPPSQVAAQAVPGAMETVRSMKLDSLFGINGVEGRYTFLCGAGVGQLIDLQDMKVLARFVPGPDVQCGAVEDEGHFIWSLGKGKDLRLNRRDADTFKELDNKSIDTIGEVYDARIWKPGALIVLLTGAPKLPLYQIQNGKIASAGSIPTPRFGEEGAHVLEVFPKKSGPHLVVFTRNENGGRVELFDPKSGALKVLGLSTEPYPQTGGVIDESTSYVLERSGILRIMSGGNSRVAYQFDPNQALQSIGSRNGVLGIETSGFFLFDKNGFKGRHDAEIDGFEMLDDGKVLTIGTDEARILEFPKPPATGWPKPVSRPSSMTGWRWGRRSIPSSFLA